MVGKLKLVAVPIDDDETAFRYTKPRLPTHRRSARALMARLIHPHFVSGMPRCARTITGLAFTVAGPTAMREPTDEIGRAGGQMMCPQPAAR